VIWKFLKKWAFLRKNGNFLAIFLLLNGNFPEGQLETQVFGIQG